MRRPRILALVGAATGIVLLIIGLVVLLRPSPRPMARAFPAPPARIISPEPSAMADPAPPVPDGVRVVLPELGIDLPLVAGDGVNPPQYKAATFPGLKLPGQGGRSLIYAHALAGMFGNLLGRGAIGQHVEIREPDGRVLRYVVREYYRSWPISDTRWLQPGDHEQVVLVTCTSYNYNDPRVVAVAEPA